MSETVTRYREWTVNDPAFPSDMREASDGDWVRYADYAALAQQLADVAYLEAWIHAPDTDRGLVTVYESKLDGEEQAWEAHDWRLDRTVVASGSDLPALGALLRQREGGR